MPQQDSPVVKSQVEAALERVLGSPGFASAGRLGPFLRFLVERSLAGEGGRLKEAVIGVEVFQRPADYDPRTDPIVRVEARRLRARLADYYEGAGAGEPVVIELPKGAYCPVFRSRGGRAQLARGAKLRPTLVVLGIGLALGAMLLVRPKPAPGNPSVVVLPFLNLSADPANEYFSEGLTEELIDRLAQIEGLRVVSRSAAFQYKGKPLDPREVGSRLGVTTVVEGSVRKAGDRLRISAQIINAADGYHLWSQSYDRQLKDVFSIQEEIARAVARGLQLRLRLGPGLARRYTENLEAYDLYLRGRYYWNQYTFQAIRKGISLFEQAIQVDPGYAPAFAMVAYSYCMLGYMGDAEAWPQAKAAAQKALALDDALPEAHVAMAMVQGLQDWKWEAAGASVRRALDLNPRLAEAHAARALLSLVPQGRLEEANAEYKRALDLDPGAGLANYGAAYCLLASGQAEEAIRQYQRTLEIISNWPNLYWDLGMAYSLAGRKQEAMKAFLTSGEVRGGGWRPGVIEYAMAGEMEKARRSLVEGSGLSRRAIYAAYAYAVMGDKARTLDLLEKALAAHDPELAWVRVEPRLRLLHGEARYEAVVKRVLSD